MPRKAKENEELKHIKKNNTTSKAKKDTKDSISSKRTSKTLATSTSTINSKKSTTSSSIQKKPTKKGTTKKASSSTKKKPNPKNTVIEYYDLPNKYNQTIVKILAQTPKTLFIYWEISDDDIESYKKQYGENFFEITRPVLIIHNDTLNYSFEVKINDFANSWYLHINDSKSDYRIELARRPIVKNQNVELDYIYISSSNKIEAPNDHILFNNSQKMLYFRNIKTNQEIQKPIYTLSFIRNMGKIYDIYDLYNELYKNEDNLENLSNPSSHTSSQFK